MTKTEAEKKFSYKVKSFTSNFHLQILKEELSETQNPTIFHCKKSAMGSFLVAGQAWVCSSLPTSRTDHSNSKVQGNLVQKATTSAAGFLPWLAHLEMLPLERAMYSPCGLWNIKVSSEELGKVTVVVLGWFIEGAIFSFHAYMYPDSSLSLGRT